MEHHLNSRRTFRYYTYGDINDSDIYLVVLHGYGQLAKYFIEKFESLSKERVFIVAPEGMHRFYINGSTGRVGASWMTKEDRETDISDNINWLSELIGSHSPDRFKRRILLGFSQGGATAARLFYDGIVDFDQLVMWASVFPPDINRNKIIKNNDSSMDCFFVVGDEDEYFSGPERNNTLDFYKSLGYITLEFNGKHTIDIPTINQIISETNQL